MFRRGCCGLMLAAVVVLLAGRTALAQDAASRDEEIQDLKRRLEALEQDKQKEAQKKDADPMVPGGSYLTDPAAGNWYDRVHIGGGIRSAFRSATQGAPDGHSPSENFELDNARLYMGAKITDMISATVNTEFNAGAVVLDAFTEFHIMEEFNVYTGRLLPATDRLNFDGPFYQATYDFPFLSAAFNSAGAHTGLRQDGVTFWGDVGHFKYWVGAYEGAAQGGFGHKDDLLYAARVQYDFFDAETGYFLQSTYYGEKKILAVGLTTNYQVNAFNPAVKTESTGNVELDVLWEEKLDFLSGGTMTVEVAYYYFGRHGFNAAQTFGVGNDLGAGTGFYALVGYLIPGHIGPGQFQPHIRYQGFHDSTTLAGRNPVDASQDEWDFGINYVISGHNARISLIYSHFDHRHFPFAPAPAGDKKTGEITIGTQVQF